MSDRYFAHPGISNSAMRQIYKAPAKFIEWIKGLPEASREPHFRIGTALHYVLLEDPKGEKFKIFEGTKTFQSKAGDAFLDMYHADYICLTREELEIVKGMEASIRSEPRIMRLIDAGQKEIEIYGHEMTEHGKIPSKAKLDVLGPNYILDIKTLRDEIHPGTIKKMRDEYCLQGAWYSHMAYTNVDAEDRDFFLIAIEKKPPYCFRFLKMRPETIEEGTRRWKIAIETYSKCLSTGQWPGYNNDLIEEI